MRNPGHGRQWGHGTARSGPCPKEAHDDRADPAPRRRADPRREAEGDGPGASARAREWLAQLEAMIQQVATAAAPVARQVGAKAAELAALAAVKAGPAAQKAADLTTEYGQRFAERAQTVAADLRQQKPRRRPAAEARTRRPRWRRPVPRRTPRRRRAPAARAVARDRPRAIRLHRGTLADRPPGSGRPVAYTRPTMSVKPIVLLGDPRLRLKGETVDSFGKYLHELLDDLTDSMRDAPGVGLAAPQLGEAVRACVIEVESQLYELVNPQIVRAHGDDRDLEGCLSIPGYVAYVTRREKVWVVAQNRFGRKIKVAGSGLLGRALQHELDHLDGKLYIDYLDSMDELIAVGQGDDEAEGDEGGDGASDARIQRATSALA